MAQSPVSTVTTAVEGLDTDLLAVGAVGLGIGATLLALRKGWSIARGFIK
jgi:L-aminopeptidase/D-esterase-like protein